MSSKLCLGAGVVALAFCYLAYTLSGCTASPLNSTEGGSPRDTSTTGDLAATGGDSTGDVTGSGATPGVSGIGTASTDGDIGSPSTGTGDGATTDGDGTSDGTPQSGTLTAGSFDDNLNLDEFRGFIADVEQADSTGALPTFQLGQRILVVVTDPNGLPLSDARVVIAAQEPNAPALVDRTTGSDGRVIFLTGLDDPTNAATYTLTVYPPDGSTWLTEARTAAEPEWRITLPGQTSELPTRLDLAFVIDSTGSMSDELEYIKTEVRSIAQSVSTLFPDVQQRYALIVYRDAGDIYVVQPFAFTAALDEFVASLNAQNADGGGDRPEAVHLALEAAEELDWMTAGTARVMFWIADAPPHTQFGLRTLTAIRALQARSISIFPVAASDTETDLESYMRAAAFLTLSEYLFLTDDSGVGNPHAKPHIPCYQVQRLDQLMIRMIRSKLAGTRIEPDAADVIRTVGNPVAGVCTAEGQDAQGQAQAQ